MAKKEIKKSKKAAQRTGPSLAVHTEQAVQDYERALSLLHKKQYSEAADRFQAVIADNPSEQEIADRCRVYVRICKRSMDEKIQPLKRLEDYYYQGIVESNRQQYDEALKHLDRALKLDPKNDRVVYLIASTLALKGERDQALVSLQEAIGLNPLNRTHAQQDPDFDLLREDEMFLALVAPRQA